MNNSSQEQKTSESFNINFGNKLQHTPVKQAQTANASVAVQLQSNKTENKLQIEKNSNIQGKGNLNITKPLDDITPETSPSNSPKKKEENPLEFPTINDSQLAIVENNQRRMANQVVFLKDALRVVPEYDGEHLSLTDFFAGLDEAKVMIGGENEANLTKICRSRLIGEARRSIRNKEFNTIEALKSHLKISFFQRKQFFEFRVNLGPCIKEKMKA